MLETCNGTVAVCPALCVRLIDTHRHHGALYDGVFRTDLFEFSLADHQNLSPSIPDSTPEMRQNACVSEIWPF